MLGPNQLAPHFPSYGGQLPHRSLGAGPITASNAADVRQNCLSKRMDRLVGGDDAVLVIDDTAILKKGTHSVGVAPQYASALGDQPPLSPGGMLV
jgi:hypothetical protein